mgnify:FL=1
MNKLLFLGGTCGNNNWRIGFIASLIALGVSAGNLFNPVVPNWNDEAQAKEDAAKTEAKYMLYYLANPGEENNTVSSYSLVEAVMNLYDAPNRTVVVFDTTGQPPHVVKAMTKSYKDLVKRFPNAPIFNDLKLAKEWLVDQLA